RTSTYAIAQSAYFACELLAHAPRRPWASPPWPGFRAMSSAPVESTAQRPPETGDLKRKIVRGAILLGVLVVVAVGIVAALPGLSGVRSAISGASPGWILAACAIQLLGVAGAVVFVQAVFDELPRRLSWWQGWGMTRPARRARRLVAHLALRSDCAS